MKTTADRIRVQNQNFVESFLRRKRLITFTELFVFLLIGIVLCLTSCAPILYTTVGQNVALFHQQGEVSLSVAHAETNYASGTGVQFAAAVNSRTLLMSSYYSLNNVAGSGSGSYFEFGAGKFKYNATTKLCTEIVLGTGFGSIRNTISNSGNSSNYFVNANYLKPFIQPSFGFSGKIFDIVFTPRIAIVTYTSRSDNATNPQIRTSLDNYFSEKHSTLVFEPGVTLRAGFKNVKFQLQYNHTSFNYVSSDNFNPVDKEFISAGIHILISDRWLKLQKR